MRMKGSRLCLCCTGRGKKEKRGQETKRVILSFCEQVVVERLSNGLKCAVLLRPLPTGTGGDGGRDGGLLKQ